MLFGVLGPVEILAAGGEYSLERSMRRAVLAFLLLHAGQVVSLDQLEDALWGGAPPASARAQMHSAVSRIRQVLREIGCADQLVTRPGGYLLTVEPGQLDLGVFDAHIARARAAAGTGQLAGAATAFREALSLWRGPALGGAAAAFVAAARQGLEDRRLLAHEDLVDSELGRGRHADVVAELGELVHANPLRERLTEQLMLALYRCGRQAEALAAYHRLRTQLADQLGIDPGREVQDRHEAILRGDPALDLGTPVVVAQQHRTAPRELPADVYAFTGRDEAMAELDKILDTAGRGPAVVISAVSGTAGVGKTALAVHWAHRVAGRFPDGQLYVNLRGFDPTGPAMRPEEALRGFLDAFAVSPQRIPSTLDAQRGMYRSLLADRRVLIVLDNALDANQVRPLLPGSSTTMVLVTSRNQLTGLVAAEGAHPVTVPLLSTVEARNLLTRRLGTERVAAEPEAVDRIVDACARLPLALAIVAARAVIRPDFPLRVLADELSATRTRLDAFSGGDPATDLRALFSWSCDALSSAAFRLFRLLGLHPGPDVPAPAVASLAALPAADATALLTELTRAHLLVEQVPGRYGWHDLLHAYATELVQAGESAADRRAVQRRLLDHYLHTGYAGARLLDPHRDPIALAPAAPGVVPETFVDAEHALAWFTTEHAALLAAIRLAAGTGFDRHAWQLSWALVDYLDRQGHWTEWATTQAIAVAATERLSDGAGQAQARRSLGRAFVRLRRYDEARVHLRQALDLYGSNGNQIGEARATFDLGHVCEQQGSHDEAVGHVERAYDLYRLAGHEGGQAQALNSLGWVNLQLGRLERALDNCRQALSLFSRIGDRRNEATTWDTLGYAHHLRGDHAEAVTCFRRAVDMFRDLGDRYLEAEVFDHIGDTRQASGDVRAARTAWTRALTIFTELGQSDAAEQVRRKLLPL